MGHHGQINVWGGAVPDNDRRLGVSLRHHGHMGKAHRAGGGTLDVDEKRVGYGDAGRQVDENPVGAESRMGRGKTV